MIYEGREPTVRIPKYLSLLIFVLFQMLSHISAYLCLAIFSIHMMCLPSLLNNIKHGYAVANSILIYFIIYILFSILTLFFMLTRWLTQWA